MTDYTERARDEALQKVCGRLEVAGDLVARAGVLYARASDAPDRQIVEMVATAAAMLGRAVDALSEDTRIRRPGPAA